MANDGNVTEQPQSRPLAQRLKRGFEDKVLVPLAVTIVSAAAHYLIRKLPQIIEEQVVPRLREQGRPETMREIVSETAALVSERVGDIAPGGGGEAADEAFEALEAVGAGAEGGAGKADGDGSKPPSKRRQLSNEEREEERRRREERRRERKKAPQKA